MSWGTFSGEAIRFPIQTAALQLQVEDDAKVADWPVVRSVSGLADEAVVAWVRVPVTDAVVPDAEFEKMNMTTPAGCVG